MEKTQRWEIVKLFPPFKRRGTACGGGFLFIYKVKSPGLWPPSLKRGKACFIYNKINVLRNRSVSQKTWLCIDR
jgi:hypothetical protein